MKKQLLFAAMLSAVMAGNVQAQQERDYTLYDFGNTTWMDAEGYTNEYLFGTFNKVSANGQYAVGYDDMLLMSTFMWNKDNPDRIEIVNNNYQYRINCVDVTNDGTVVGSYESSSTEGMRPAYMSPDGEWTMLPVPEDYSVSYAQGFMGIDHARAVTPDGNYIAGHVYISTGTMESPLGGTIERVQLVPCRWQKKGDTYELTDVYRDLGNPGNSALYNGEEFETVNNEVAYTTFFVYDISNDGNTIVGVNTSDTGGQNPAFIRNSKLMQIYDCASEDTYTFNGGICNSIDANGNIYGYFQDDDMAMTYFVFTADNRLEFVDQLLTCGTADGTRFAQSSYGLPYTLDCSEDGSVVVGGSVASTGFGASNTPALLVSDTPTTSVDRINAIRNNVNISYKGRILCVTGEYDKAEIFNAQGSLVAEGGQGKAFNLSAQPAGAYIIKVTTANGVKTFKIAR